MNNINPIYQETVRIQTVVCGLLFSIFSFVYLYVFQCDVLEALHFSLAHGKTQFSAFGSALVITLILLLLKWGINRFIRLRGRANTLSYLPSFFVLMALSDVGRDVYLRTSHTLWLWLLPLLIGGYIAIAYSIKKNVPYVHNTGTNRIVLIASNVAVLLVGCIMTFLVGNTDTTFHHELQMEKYLRQKDYQSALKVGEKAMEASQTMTALRSYALSNMNQMGEKLFHYPQYFGSEGLLFPNDSMCTLRYTNDSIFRYLGIPAYTNSDNMDSLRSFCYNDKGKFTTLDYYLVGLLLDKQLDSFVSALADFYLPEDTLPTHYKEALLIYQAKHPDSTFGQVDSTLIQKYSAYSQRQAEFSSKREETNRMRREYGDTYWWYYDYQGIKASN